MRRYLLAVILLVGTASFVLADASFFLRQVIDEETQRDVQRIFEEQEVNHAPIWSTDAVLGNFTAGFDIDLTLEANDEDDDSLAFSATDLQAWLSLDSNGHLTGTAPAEVDDYNFIGHVDDGQETANRTFTITVVADEVPVWNNDGALGLLAYPATIDEILSATDPEEQTVTFSIQSVLPVSPGINERIESGALKADVPDAIPDDINYTITVRASDPAGGYADKDFTFTAEGRAYDSCQDAYDRGVSQDGTLNIDLDGRGGAAPFEVYCDMTTDGGVWTRVNAHIASSSRSFNASDQIISNGINGWCRSGGYNQFTISNFQIPYDEYRAILLRGTTILQCSGFTGHIQISYWNGSNWVDNGTCLWGDYIWAKNIGNISSSGLPNTWRFLGEHQDTLSYTLNCGYASDCGAYTVTIYIRLTP